MKHNGYEIKPYANLRNADLWSANLWNANLRSADLRNANLRSADLRNADLRSADLRNADLRSADLRNANLRSADLRNAKFKDTTFGNTTWNRAPLIYSPGYGQWTISEYGDGVWRIGCKEMTVAEWANHYKNPRYKGSLDATQRELYMIQLRAMSRISKILDSAHAKD